MFEYTIIMYLVIALWTFCLFCCDDTSYSPGLLWDSLAALTWLPYLIALFVARLHQKIMM